MQELLDQIKNNLVSPDSNVESTLLAAKILAAKIKSNELSEWVNKELNGYGNDDEVPSYRTVGNILTGTATNGFHINNGITVPTMHLDKKIQNALQETTFKDSIGGLEGLSRGDDETGQLIYQMSPEIISIINRDLPATRGFRFSSVNKIISPSVLKGIFTVIKSKLLDFVLELEGEFSNSEEMKQNPEKVSQIFQTHIQGNNNTIITAVDHSEVGNVNINFTIEDVRKRLEEKGLPEEFIKELEEILPTETKEDFVESGYGPKVEGWLKKVYEKAVDKVWEVPFSTAGQILTGILNQYYGLYS